MTAPAVDVDQLPPVQYLILETLAARHRTGEAMWTFPSRLRHPVDALAGLGLVGWKSGIVQRTVLVWLTDAGRVAALLDGYPSPDVRQYQRLRHRLATIHFQYRTAWTDEFDTCAGCTIGMRLVPWPCRTWRMIEDLNPEKAESTRVKGHPCATVPQ